MTTRTFFASAAPDGSIGLFTSDGTPGGTVQIAVPDASPHGVRPQRITVIGSIVFFQGAGSDGYPALFTYNAATGLVAKVAVPGSSAFNANPNSFTAAGSKVLFGDNAGVNQFDLFSYDVATGLAAQVSLPGGGNILLTSGPTVAGSKVLFGGTDSAGNNNLFSYDTATGLVAAVAVTGASTVAVDPHSLTAAGTKVLFTGTDPSNNVKLFSYDNVTGSTAAISGGGVASFSGQSLGSFAVAGTKVVFEALDGAGKLQLFSYDTATGITVEANAGAGSVGTGAYVAAGSKVLFVGTDALGNKRLFSYDTSTGSVAQVSVGGGNTGNYALTQNSFAALGANALFTGTDAAGNAGLFSYNGAANTAVEILPTTGSPLGTGPTGPASNGTTATFYATDQSGFYAYWKSDGTAAGTAEIFDPGQAQQPNLRPNPFAVIGSKVLFGGTDSNRHGNLFGYDIPTGTAAEVGGNGGSLSASRLTVIGSKVLIAGSDSSNHPNLFTYDPATGLVAQVSVSGASSGGVDPGGTSNGSFTVAGSKVLFQGTDGANHASLFSYDTATGSAAVVNVPSGSGAGLNPTGFTVAGSKVLFAGNDSTNHQNLFTYDLASGSTAEVNVTGANALDGLNPKSLTTAGSKVLFSGEDNTSTNRNLFSYDTANGSVVEVAVSGASSGGLTPTGFTVAGSKVLFAGSDSANHQNLFTYDLATGSTAEVNVTGANALDGLNPKFLTNVGSKVLFSGEDNTSTNQNLFSYDTATGSVVEVAVTGADSGGVTPASFTVAGSKVLFTGRDASYHQTLFTYDPATGTAAEVNFNGTGVGDNSLNPRALTVAGSTVLFQGAITGGGSALYSYDTGTGAVKEIAVPGEVNFAGYTSTAFAGPDLTMLAITSPAVAGRTATQTISGTLVVGGSASAAGQTITLTDNGVALSTAAPVVTDAQGQFSTTVTLTYQGANSLVAKSQNGTGTTAQSAPVVDTLDTVAPTLAIAVPGPAVVASNPALAPFGTEVVTGKLVSGGSASAAGQVVTLLGNGVALSTAAPVVTDAQGAFSATVALPGADPVSLSAKSADSYGNATTSTSVSVTSRINAELFGTAAIDPKSPATLVNALYGSILGQAPDPTSFQNALAAITSGTSLITLAQSLLSSSQYTAQYGAAAGRSPTDFVTTLYNDGLGRNPETAGLQYWTGRLSSGAETQAQVAVDIGVSPESIGRLQPGFLLPDSMFVQNRTDADVARLYYGLLGRGPDSGGMQFYEGLLNHGFTLADVVGDFMASPEYLAEIASAGVTTNAQFVTLLYKNALGRTPEPGQGWTAFLDKGQSKVSVALGIVEGGEGGEAKAHLAPMIEQGFKLG